MGRLIIRFAVAISLVVLATIQPSPAHAQPTSDVTYEGTQEAGGPVRLVVSGDGARIVHFEAEGIAGGGCSWDTITLDNWGGEVAVADNHFESRNVDGDLLQGAMTGDTGAPRRVEGIIQVNDQAKGCQTPPLRWVATVPSQ
jgi:hypothetical protein